MRKLWTAVITAVMVLSAVSVAYGEDYSARALAHLRTRYGNQAKEITLLEGGLTQLELTGETFWMAKYFLGKSGGGSSPAAPAGKDTPITPPDQTVISPVPPNKGTIVTPAEVGLVAIRIATGKILDRGQMETFYQAEQAAWERLSAEAGKIEISLYRKLHSQPAEARLPVVIQPSVQLTHEIRAKLTALRSKYPLAAAGLTLSDDELLGGGATARDLPVVNKAEPAIAIAPYNPQAPVPSDRAYVLQSEAFFAALGQLRVEAVQESVKAIRSALAALGASHSVELGGHEVRAELTAKEVASLASLSAVASIFEHMTAVPSAAFGREPAMSTAQKGTDAMQRQSTEAGIVKNWHRGYQVAGSALMLTFFLIGIYALTTRRIK